MKKLYMIFLGGYMSNANIEVHDTQFLYTEDVSSELSELERRWFGDALHIDGLVVLETIDGYKLIPNESSKDNLYMVVYGGYHTDFLGEVHQYDFIVSSSVKQAKMIAKDKLNHLGMDHIDEIVDVFENVGVRFGLKAGNYHFKNNQMNQTYIKIIDQSHEV